MKNMKKLFCMLTLALLSLTLLAGCGSSGRKWRDTDVIDDYGTITRDGKQIDVCVTHDQKTIYFYYDDEDHKLFDTAKLPTDEIYDKDWLLGNIIFCDFTGDNNSDLQVYLEHADMSESYIVWTWEEGEGYVYQPYDSWFYHSIVVRDPTYDDEFGIYEGVWLSYPDNPYDDIYYIEFDRDGSWQLHSEIDVIDDGYLYTADDGFTYVCSYQEGEIGGGYIELDDDQLYISTLGYFSHLISEENSYSDDDSGKHTEYPTRKGGGLDDPVAFTNYYSARTADGTEADDAVTPQIRELIGMLEAFAANSRVAALSLHNGELTLALHTSYKFAYIPPKQDLKNIDGIRMSYTATLTTMAALLDLIRGSFAKM